MTKEINLFPRKNTNNRKKKQIELYFRIAAIFVLFVVSFTAILLFFLQSQSAVPSLQQEEKLLLDQLSSLHSKTAKYLITNERLRNIADITLHRYPMDKLFGTIALAIPLAVKLDGFSVEKKILVVSTTSSSLAGLNTFIDNMTKLVKDKKFLKKLTLNSIGYDYKSSAYSLSIEADLL